MDQKAKSHGKLTISEEKERSIEELLNSLRNSESVEDIIPHFENKLTLQEKLDNISLYKPIQRQVSLDKSYLNDLNEKHTSPEFRKTLKIRKNIRVYQRREEILDLIKENPVVVIHGESGYGKTTQVPQLILDDFIENSNGSLCKIISSQPYRKSAVKAAQRVANDRDENFSSTASVGYQIKMERNLPRSFASIIYYTSGTLLKILGRNPFLNGVSHLILDELQERDFSTEILLAAIKYLTTKRDDLKLVLITSSVYAKKISAYFNRCPKLNVTENLHQVEEFFLEDILEILNTDAVINKNKKEKDQCLPHGRKNLVDYDLDEGLSLPRRKKSNKHVGYEKPAQGPSKCKLAHVLEDANRPDVKVFNFDLVAELVQHICRFYQKGSVLVFLPTVRLITALKEKLEASATFPVSEFCIVPVHASGAEEERGNLRLEKRRKVYLSTSIAESSLTFKDVAHVVDNGRITTAYYDSNYDVEEIKQEWISRKSAEQRRKLASRAGNGTCFHLFSKTYRSIVHKYLIPQILRCNLNDVILKIKSSSLGNVEHFLSTCLSPPDPDSIRQRLKSLQRAQILTADERLTSFGRFASKLSLNHSLSKMILLGAIFSCLDPVLTIAATIDHKHLHWIPKVQNRILREKKSSFSNKCESDQIFLLKFMKKFQNVEQSEKKQFCSDYFLNLYAVEQITTVKQELYNTLRNIGFISTENYNKNSENFELIKSIICAGLYPNVAVIKNYQSHILKNISFMTTENEKLLIDSTSVNVTQTEYPSPFLMYRSLIKTNNKYMRETTSVYPISLLLFGDKFTIEKDKNRTVINMSDTLKILCDESTAVLIKELRKELDYIIDYYFVHPDTINWEVNSKEVTILRAVVNLLQRENEDNSSDDSD